MAKQTKEERAAEAELVQEIRLKRNNHDAPYRRVWSARIGSTGRAKRPTSLTSVEFSLLNQSYTRLFSLQVSLTREVNKRLGIAEPCAGEPDPETALSVRPKAGLDAGARATFKALQRGEESRAMIEERNAREAAEAKAELAELEARKLLSGTFLGRHMTSAENAVIQGAIKQITAKDLKALREAKSKLRVAEAAHVIDHTIAHPGELVQ